MGVPVPGLCLGSLEHGESHGVFDLSAEVLWEASLSFSEVADFFVHPTLAASILEGQAGKRSHWLPVQGQVLFVAAGPGALTPEPPPHILTPHSLNLAS